MKRDTWSWLERSMDWNVAYFMGAAIADWQEPGSWMRRAGLCLALSGAALFASLVMACIRARADE